MGELVVLTARFNSEPFDHTGIHYLRPGESRILPVCFAVHSARRVYTEVL